MMTWGQISGHYCLQHVRVSLPAARGHAKPLRLRAPTFGSFLVSLAWRDVGLFASYTARTSLQSRDVQGTHTIDEN